MLRIALALLILIIPHKAHALDIMGLWLTPDQQGRLKYEQGEFQSAARLFEDKRWKALAFYHAGDFANAAALFEKFESPWGLLNLGNSYAKTEQLSLAEKSYIRALELKPDFPEAEFNLEWVSGLIELDAKEYDDAGGSDGKLGADRIVIDERGSKATSEMSMQEAVAQVGLSDQELQDMWMRRVQTTPGDFLRLKFTYQLNAAGSEDGETE